MPAAAVSERTSATEGRTEGRAKHLEMPTEAHAVLLDEPDATGDLVDDTAVRSLLGDAVRPDCPPADCPPSESPPGESPPAESRPDDVADLIPGFSTRSAPATSEPVRAAVADADVDVDVDADGSSSPVRPVWRYGDDSPTSPGLEITRTSAVWFWLWGPLLAAVVVVSFLAGMASAPVSLPSPPEAHPASIDDVYGRPLATVEPPASAEQVPAEQLPDLLLRAIVAVQDPGYFSRRGLSAADLLAAGASDVVRVRRHGTTIEERYVRQVRIAAGSSLPSLRESTVAVRLSQRLSRRALLARYVNGMYFGNGVYGVAAAARFYFGQPVGSLDAAQIALLAGIADDPSGTNPVTAPALAIQGQQRALDRDARERAPRPCRGRRSAPRAGRRPRAPTARATVAGARLHRPRRVLAALAIRRRRRLRASPAGHHAARPGPADRARRRGAHDGADQRPRRARRGDRSAHRRRPGAAQPQPQLLRHQARRRGRRVVRPTPTGDARGCAAGTVGDGRSASLGEVASAAGAIVAGGAWHDLRPLTGVVRPASAGQSTVVLDAADPLPAGRPFVSVDAATAAVSTSRAAARLPGSPSADLPFALTALRGTDGPVAPDAIGSTRNAHWFVGCVPDLCVTIWTGPGNPTAGSPADSGAATDPAELIATDTFRRYITAAPDRIDLPALPQPRVEVRRPAPVATATAAPTPTATPSAARTATPTPAAVKPTPSAVPSVRPPAGGAAPTTPSPSPSAGGSTPGGSGSQPVAAGGPPASARDGRT